MQSNDALIVPFFKTVPKYMAAQSAKAGRPIYKDVEMVEVRIAGERQYAPTFPAHAMWQRVNGEEITYAKRWPKEYAAFREQNKQVAEGTPLSEAPFLTEARRAELRHNKVYTIEALASIDGKNLSNLGPDGRKMKDQATDYLERALGGSREAEMKSQIAELQAQIAAMKAKPVEKEQGKPVEPYPPEDEGDTADADEIEALKEEYQSIFGHRPKGNPKAETIRAMIDDSKG